MDTTFTYNGHANLSLETSGYKLLIDPWFTGNPWVKMSADDVVADYLLVTHAHGDHLGQTVEIAKRTGAVVIANSEICKKLGNLGIDVHGMHIGGGHHFPFGYVKLTNAQHGSAFPDGSYGGNPVGFLIKTLDGKTIYLAGDTGLFGDMRMIGEEGLDLAVIPIGDHYTMGPDDALKAVKLLEPKQVVPIHYNTFEVIKQDPQAWKIRVEAETSTKVFVLQPGETLIV
jgi:L-ascorbate metabolism protein UlaG (beta-lactamase superfamily)